MSDWLKAKIVAWQVRRSIKRIRRDMAALGYPIDDLTDEEIKEACGRMAKVAVACGVTAEEAAAAIATVSSMLPPLLFPERVREVE